MNDRQTDRSTPMTPITPEHETQILDGLRWADCLLASFGRQPQQLDVAALVTLRTLEWADDHLTIGQVRQLLQSVDTVPELRKVS